MLRDVQLERDAAVDFAQAIAERRLALLRDVQQHIFELEDAWAKGALSEHDGKGGTRSSRNTDLRVAIAAELVGKVKETLA